MHGHVVSAVESESLAILVLPTLLVLNGVSEWKELIECQRRERSWQHIRIKYRTRLHDDLPEMQAWIAHPNPPLNP